MPGRRDKIGDCRKWPHTKFFSVAEHGSRGWESAPFFTPPNGFFIRGNGRRKKKYQTKPITHKPMYFNNLTYICGLCAVMFTKLTVEAELLEQLPSRLAIRRSLRRELHRAVPVRARALQMAFSSAEAANARRMTKQSRFSYKPSYFNNLDDLYEAMKRCRSAARRAQWLPTREAVLCAPRPKGPGYCTISLTAARPNRWDKLP